MTVSGPLSEFLQFELHEEHRGVLRIAEFGPAGELRQATTREVAWDVDVCDRLSISSIRDGGESSRVVMVASPNGAGMTGEFRGDTVFLLLAVPGSLRSLLEEWNDDTERPVSSDERGPAR